jgi:hypothetical protein
MLWSSVFGPVSLSKAPSANLALSDCLMALHRLLARNAGQEQILEAYYNVALLDFAHFTANYQFVNHPAYNRDRGPVSGFGMRLHVQY